MSDDERRPAPGEAYTGDTIAMPRRRPDLSRRPDRPRRPGSPPVRRPPRPRRQIGKLVRRALLALLALLALALVLFYLQVRSVASQIVVADPRPSAPAASPLLGGMNVLVVGVDERPDHPEEGVRSDTLIVVHLDLAGRWVSMLSIPRDTRANVPGIGETKINAAYGQGYAAAESIYGAGVTPRQGGMALAAQTVEGFLMLPERGQRVDAVAQVNFDGFAKVIDALGGVDIDVPRAIVDDAYPTPDFGTMRIEFKPGLQHMDGATALIYARTRHADSDFGRAERQQQVLRAIGQKLKARGPFGAALAMPKLLGGLNGAVTTTMPIARPDVLLGLLWIGSGFSPDQIGQTALTPQTAPNYREEGSDLIWDPNDVRAVVSGFLTRPTEASEAATVQVLNGTDAAGLAGKVTDELDRAGFTVIPADNAPTSGAQKTVIYDVKGKPRTAARLAKQLGAAVVSGAPEGVASQADIVVVLGKDAAK